MTQPRRAGAGSGSRVTAPAPIKLLTCRISATKIRRTNLHLRYRCHRRTYRREVSLLE